MNDDEFYENLDSDCKGAVASKEEALCMCLAGECETALEQFQKAKKEFEYVLSKCDSIHENKMEINRYSEIEHTAYGELRDMFAAIIEHYGNGNEWEDNEYYELIQESARKKEFYQRRYEEIGEAMNY